VPAADLAAFLMPPGVLAIAFAPFQQMLPSDAARFAFDGCRRHGGVRATRALRVAALAGRHVPVRRLAAPSSRWARPAGRRPSGRRASGIVGAGAWRRAVVSAIVGWLSILRLPKITGYLIFGLLRAVDGEHHQSMARDLRRSTASRSSLSFVAGLQLDLVKVRPRCSLATLSATTVGIAWLGITVVFRHLAVAADRLRIDWASSSSRRWRSWPVM
jgi:hypothetical protein